MRTLIRNLGQIVSGDIAMPLLDADEILIVDGRIATVGRGITGGDAGDADQVIDARGSTAFPGLIDSHAHPVFGDFTPRQRTLDFIESGLHGGVTTVMSAGEVHLPGRPKDIVGLKALAVVAVKSYENLRPAGVKVHAGAPILEIGLEERDFAEMAAAGVRLVGEIGLGSVKTGAQAAPMVAWAKQYGMIVTFHTGGPSIAGSSAVGADTVLEAQPHIVGLKALAIVAVRSYENLRPAGVKVHAGAPILELGLEEHDFAEMSAAGVRLVGEIGLGSVKTGAQAAPMVAWARQHGMIVTFHTGGPSITGSSAIGADTVLEARPHIVGHVNGGTTAMSDADIERLVGTDMAIEIVQCGNGRAALHAVRAAAAARGLDRVILGNDAPSGTGVIPLGILRTMAHLASLGGVAPEVAVAMATGNTARVHSLDVGVIAPGRAADLVLVDAPVGSGASTALGALAIGDLPGISMVIIDGQVKIGRSRNTAPAARAAEVIGGDGPAAGGH